MIMVVVNVVVVAAATIPNTAGTFSSLSMTGRSRGIHVRLLFSL